MICSWVTHGRSNAPNLMTGISAEALPADRGYDTDAMIACALDEGLEAVIPPKRNRKEQRVYDEYRYKLRHLFENAFLILKRWRGIATRYAKTSESFLAAVQVRCIAIWTSVFS
ncbi:MAG: transposase [Clostridiales bacterium]|nr:transposase [Clostridiales bacterium]